MKSNENFEQCARRYIDTVFRVAFSYLKNRPDADDVTQNVLLRLYQTRKDFASEAHLKNWLLRVTVNECKMLWRSRRHTESITENEPRPEDSRCAELFEAVMALDGKYRVPVFLFYYEGYSTKEIAQMLSLPVNTVSTRLSRARKQLKKWLTEAETI